VPQAMHASRVSIEASVTPSDIALTSINPLW
jgi:hypothetical protein